MRIRQSRSPGKDESVVILRDRDYENRSRIVEQLRQASLLINKVRGTLSR